MKHSTEISQKSEMCPFGADFSLKKCMQGSCTKLYYEQGCLQIELPDWCFYTALNPFFGWDF